MGLFNRALLTIFCFFLAVIFAILIGMAAVQWTTPLQYLQTVLLDNNQRLVFGVLSAIFFAISFKFFLTSLTLQQPDKHAVVQENNLGQIKISLQAIENLVRRMVSQVKGVKEVKPQVREFPEGVSIYIKAIVTPDTKIPQIAEEVQKMVREKVFELTGVSVIDVRILVDNISTDKARVE